MKKGNMILIKIEIARKIVKDVENQTYKKC